MTKTVHVIVLAGAIGLVAVLLVAPASLRFNPNKSPTVVSAISVR